MTTQTLFGGGLPSHMAAHTQRVRVDRILKRTHQRCMALGAVCIAWRRGRQYRAKAR